MHTRYVNLYLKPSGEIIVGDLYTKESTAEREGFGNYVKLRTTTVYLTDEQLKLIENN